MHPGIFPTPPLYPPDLIPYTKCTVFQLCLMFDRLHILLCSCCTCSSCVSLAFFLCFSILTSANGCKILMRGASGPLNGMHGAHEGPSACWFALLTFLSLLRHSKASGEVQGQLQHDQGHEFRQINSWRALNWLLGPLIRSLTKGSQRSLGEHRGG